MLCNDHVRTYHQHPSFVGWIVSRARLDFELCDRVRVSALTLSSCFVESGFHSPVLKMEVVSDFFFSEKYCFYRSVWWLGVAHKNCMHAALV